MKISKYTSYFHDGLVHDIKHNENTIELSIESAELLPEWNEENIILSKRNTITGKLHLEGVSSVKINGKSLRDKLIKNYDDGNIYHIEIQGKKLLLEVSWENYPPKKREETDVFTIYIEAEKIYWENILTLFDAIWDSSK